MNNPLDIKLGRAVFTGDWKAIEQCLKAGADLLGLYENVDGEKTCVLLGILSNRQYTMLDKVLQHVARHSPKSLNLSAHFISKKDYPDNILQSVGSLYGVRVFERFLKHAKATGQDVAGLLSQDIITLRNGRPSVESFGERLLRNANKLSISINFSPVDDDGVLEEFNEKWKFCPAERKLAMPYSKENPAEIFLSGAESVLHYCLDHDLIDIYGLTSIGIPFHEMVDRFDDGSKDLVKWNEKDGPGSLLRFNVKAIVSPAYLHPTDPTAVCIDIQNTNMLEAHPMYFRAVTEYEGTRAKVQAKMKPAEESGMLHQFKNLKAEIDKVTEVRLNRVSESNTLTTETKSCILLMNDEIYLNLLARKLTAGALLDPNRVSRESKIAVAFSQALTTITSIATFATGGHAAPGSVVASIAGLTIDKITKEYAKDQSKAVSKNTRFINISQLACNLALELGDYLDFVYKGHPEVKAAEKVVAFVIEAINDVKKNKVKDHEELYEVLLDAGKKAILKGLPAELKQSIKANNSPKSIGSGSNHSDSTRTGSDEEHHGHGVVFIKDAPTPPLKLHANRKKGPKSSGSRCVIS